jgi:glycosyltransferase involved in cell wall biosynthesis
VPSPDRDPTVRTLLVDARPVDHPTARQRGIGRYVTGLLAGLHQTGAPVIALHGSDLEAEVLADAIPGLTLARWHPETIRRHVAPGTWYVATQLMLHPIPLDPIPSVITAARLPVAAVMYDVIPYRFPDRYQAEPSARYQAQVRKPLARTVDAMLAISRFAAVTAADELEFPLDRIAMIGAGVDDQFVPAAVRRHQRPDRVLPPDVERYVVAVTGGDERKNTEGLLRAWALVDPAIRSSRHLVIATAASEAVLRRWRQWADDLDIGDRTVLTGSVTDDEMVAILQHAELAVMPSTEEGFGLPVVEAAACGCPVICSNVTSLPEVLEEPLAEFDPYDTASIARALERALVDAAHRAVLRAAGERAASRWRWTNVARDTVDALATLGPRWPQRPRSPATRTALVGPFGDSTSGIGAYDEQLLAALARRDAHAVDPFVDTSESPTPVVDPRRPARALPRYAKPWDYDHIVAALGSSPHHVATAQLAADTPCHVWLHEASLVGVHVGLAHRSGSGTWAAAYVADVLERTESATTRAQLRPGDELDAPRLDELGVTMLADVVRRSRSVIVSSERAAEVVRQLDTTLDLGAPPMLVMPLAHERSGRIVVDPAPGDIVAAGWLAANKAPELAVEVLAALGDRTATLTFVGPAVPAAVDAVRAAAERHGVATRVSVTDRLDDDAYRARLATAHVGLQLRRGDGGAMSAATGDLLSLGVPVVTTMHSAGPPSEAVQIVDDHDDGHDGHDREQVAALAAAVAGLLDDDAAWRRASADAVQRAGAWTFDDVADALLGWLDRTDELPPGTIERCGPATALRH